MECGFPAVWEGFPELMAIKIVLYDEGRSELGNTYQITPGRVINAESYGPAHILVQRQLSVYSPKPLEFLAPLRKPNGQHRIGSDLLNKKSLRQALTWPPRETRTPDFAIIIVDQDGDKQRKTNLLENLQGITLGHVIALARQEFESWLITDYNCVNKILEKELQNPQEPEKKAPGEAKKVLNRAIKEVGQNYLDIYYKICQNLDLELLRKNRSYEDFASELRGVLN